MFLILKAAPNFDRTMCNDMVQVFSKSVTDGQKINIFRKETQKPVDDSFFLNTVNHVCLTEGVIVNAGHYVNKTAAKDIQSIVIQSMLKPETGILAKMHGQFCGLIYDIDDSLIRVFTNQINSLRVYYYYSESVFIAGTSLRLINLLLQSNGISTTVDEIGSRMMLTYGYMLSDFTTIKEIRQIKAGFYIEHSNNSFSVKQYHGFNNEIKHINLKTIVPEMHELFCKAVRYSFEKDISFRKKHLAFLSGGLDSRQCVMIADEIGYKKISCLNFSEPGYQDETIARKIAKALNLNFIFYSLKNGDYLLRLDKNLEYNFGQITLHGSGHLYAAVSSLDLTNYGLLHSGQLGDALLGTYLSAYEHLAPDLSARGYSMSLFDTISKDIEFIKDDYPNHELCMLNNRGFNGIMNGDYASAQHNYTVSPFLYPEFAQYCLNIDPKLRYKHYCYKEWVRGKNRFGASFKWEKTGTNLLVPDWYSKVVNKSQKGVDKACRMITGKPNRKNMNPFDYWWKTNPDLEQHFRKTPEELTKIRHLISTELYKDTLTLFQSRVTTEKMLAYTLISGLKYLYNYQ